MEKYYFTNFLLVTRCFLWGIFLQFFFIGALYAIEKNPQNANLQEVITDLDVQHEQLKRVQSPIKSKNQLQHPLNPNELESSKKVSINSKDLPLYGVLVGFSMQPNIKFNQPDLNTNIQNLEEYEGSLAHVKTSLAQRIITGRVVNEKGEGIPGVTVRLKGSGSIGTVTDIEGNYRLSLPAGQEDGTLVFSFVGFKDEEEPISNRSTIDVQLEQDVQSLQELVVVGYGTQEEKDLTSAISTIDAEEITQTPTGQAMQSLQGKVAGVQIVSSGAPGAGPTVRVRGVGSLQGDTSPLYVVDGMFFDNIDFINPNDIQTISILKDASAAAIYGVRAANGVVLVETKSGTYNQEPQIVYDGYYGIQRAQNVLKLANAEQFARYIRETGAEADISFIDNAFQRYGRSRINPNVPDVNTDWYDEVLQIAPMQNHSLSISGGGERTRYSVGANFFEQDGLLQVTRNGYERYNFRSKVDFKAKEWLSAGLNINFSNATQYVAENSVWFKSYFAVPILPVYDDLNTDATPIQLANAQQLGYRGTQNPFFDLFYNDNRNKINRLLANVYLDFELIPNKLSFRTTYNYSYGGVDSRNVNFRFNDGQVWHPYAISKRSTTSLDGIWDNVLTYQDYVGSHNFTLLAGYSYRSETNNGVFARAEGTTEFGAPERGMEELWYLSSGGEIDVGGVGDFGSRFFGTSYFGRIAYNYDERYLLYGTFRRDGTNKFQQKWGNFPTIGLGWVVSEEDFFEAGFVDFLKFRGSWGKLGNAGVAAAVGAPTLVPLTTAINDQRVPGSEVGYVFDYLDRWETTVETNIGISSRFFENRLSLEADYYVRDTEDAVVTIILPLIRENIRRNMGEIRNSGFEFALNWTDNLTDDFSYSFGGNFATLKNEVLSLGGQPYLDAGSAEFRQRSIVGEPIGAFYGYEVAGVYQSEQQIAESELLDEFVVEQGLEPGDFIYRDQNNDGIINDQDRVVLGSYLPNLTYGANVALNWRGLEFSALVQGQSGHSILNRKRGEIIFTTDTNLDADLANNLWRGEGTSNIYPSAAGLRKGWNQAMSDYFVEDGSYFRIQNVRLAYSLLNTKLFGATMPDARITLTAERPLTVFSYHGFNPEVANGIDRQTYPIPAVYTIGLNLKL